ncbi:MAG: S46 family peptidase [Terriglobia bacterium]
MIRSNKPRRVWILLTLAIWALLGISLSLADEGMWTFDNPPIKQLKERYGFEPTREWLDHVRLSSVRFNDGGSGSFVSPRGLVLTNHHVALTQLEKVSSPAKDYVKDGFFARTEAEELKCPDLEVNVLVAMEDVTPRVLSAVEPGMTGEAALKARKAAMAKIEKESLERTGLRSDVIPLYQGGEYWLYQYKKYTEMRLVFAPEQQIAFFGGDPDNFTFPRHDLDFALFRVYENGKPVENKYYLKWNAKGADDGELVFVSGHPGSTSRLETMTQIETERDYDLPLVLKVLNRRVETARRYGAQGPEQARQAARIIFFTENSLKVFKGRAQGLADKALAAKMHKDEASFRALVASQPEWENAYGGAWDAIAQAEMKHRHMLKTYRLYSLRWSRLAEIALNIVQYAAEVKKPDGERLEGYHDSQLDSLRFRLFSPAPIYPGYDAAMLEGALQLCLEELSVNHPFIKAVLGARTPAEVAKVAVEGTKLADPAYRKSLVDGGEAAIQASSDPMMGLARTIDPFDRRRIKAFEDNVESVETPAGEKIGQARFAVYGKSLYPDATFTLRLAYGAVKGYPMNGTQAPPMTTFYGLYDRAYSFGLKPPYNLPARYLERRTRLYLAGPLDFVNTCDIIGGNSGSPVINRQGELVGLIFDGNIESLVGDYVYNEVNNRAVAVHSGAIIEALRELYDASSLADELEGR